MQLEMEELQRDLDEANTNLVELEEKANEQHE